MHLDIAGVMSNKSEVPYLNKGMAGENMPQLNVGYVHQLQDRTVKTCDYVSNFVCCVTVYRHSASGTYWQGLMLTCIGSMKYRIIV